MLRHVLFLVGLTVIAVVFQDQLMIVLHGLLYVHDKIAKGLGVVFSIDSLGEIVQFVLALLIIPVIVGVLVAVAHFVLKQAHFPHTMTVIWACWAVLLVAVLSEVSTNPGTPHFTHAARISVRTASSQSGPQQPAAGNAGNMVQ